MPRLTTIGHSRLIPIMSRKYTAEYDDDDGEEFDVDESDDLETVPCPSCGREIYEEAEQCPHCGKYVAESERPGVNRPLWFIITALVCLYVVWRSMF